MHPRDTNRGAGVVPNSRGLEELYTAYGAVVYRLARQVIGDEYLAQDVTQDVFLAVWSGRAGVFDPARGSERAWLLQIAHHKAVDKVRRTQRHSGRNAGPDMIVTVLSDTNVETDAWVNQRRTHIVAALADLTDPQRQVLELAYFGGYSQSEIARLTATPLGTVKTRTQAALRRLRDVRDLAALAAADGWAGTPIAVNPATP